MIVYRWEGLGRRSTTVTVQSVYSRLATGPIEEPNQALAQAPEPTPAIAPAPELPPATAPKKTTQVVARIEAQLVVEGEVTKQIMYMLIAQTTACRKPGCRNISKRCINWAGGH
jgi:hypothetical protein